MSGFSRAAISSLDLLDAGRLQVVEEHRNAALALLELDRHRRRSEMAGDVGDSLHGVVEAAVHPDPLQVLGAIGDLPQPLRRAGVARPEEARIPVLDQEAVSRHDVVHRNRRESHATGATHLADDDRNLVLQLVEADHRQQVIGQAGEIGPGVVVEEMPPQGVDRRRRGVDVDRFAELPEDVLDEKRQRRGVIHVGMGQHDRVDEPLAGDRQALRQRAGIERDDVVQQETGHAAVDAFAAIAAQNLYFHRLPVIVLSLDFLRQ